MTFQEAPLSHPILIVGRQGPGGWRSARGEGRRLSVWRPVALQSRWIWGNRILTVICAFCLALLVGWWTRGVASGPPMGPGVTLLPSACTDERLGRWLRYKLPPAWELFFSWWRGSATPATNVNNQGRKIKGGQAPGKREEGCLGWPGRQLVLMTSFIGNFSNDRFRLLPKRMEIIDSKFSLFLFLCVIPDAGIKTVCSHKQWQANAFY